MMIIVIRFEKFSSTNFYLLNIVIDLFGYIVISQLYTRLSVFKQFVLP